MKIVRYAHRLPRFFREGRGIACWAGAVLLLGGAPAQAVVRTCGPNASTNTTDVLCAAPSGPCDATTVRLSENLEVTNSGCVFDLGGRALLVSKTFQMASAGYISIENAADVTLTATGQLKARGDFGVPPQSIGSGGEIHIDSSGVVTVAGVIDVYGDGAGVVRITADGDVVLAGGSVIRGVGDTADADARYADGGELEIVSGGSITVNGDVNLQGQLGAQGGEASLRAARNITINQAIDASGGAGGGGTILLDAGDDVAVYKTLNAESAGSGGPGGEIAIDAGDDSVGGVASGGNLTIYAGSLKLNASGGASSDDDDGGSLRLSANGLLRLAPDAVVYANAANGTTGSGGAIQMNGGSGDVSIEAPIHSTSGDNGGRGGSATISANGTIHLTNSGDLTLTGKERGGQLLATAGASYAQESQVLLNGVGQTTGGGEVDVTACDLNLSGTARLEASGTSGSTIVLTGRRTLAIGSSTNIQATGVEGAIALITRRFGTCANNASRHCRSNADCTIGCSTSTCNDIAISTAGTTSQFNPAPVVAEDATLAACP